jgi:hypothetical protein
MVRNVSNSITVGLHSRLEDSTTSDNIAIVRKIKHPLHRNSRFPFDLLILQLANVTYNHPYIRLFNKNKNNNPKDGIMETSSVSRLSAPVNNDDSTIPMNLTIIGLGDVRQGPQFVYPTTLQEAFLNYIPNDQCEDSHLSQGNPVTDDMLCAAAPGIDAW